MNAVLDDPQKVWTYADYLALNQDTVFEIINGKAFMPPVPELLHQRWARKIFLAVERHIEAHNLGEVFFAPVDVVLDEKNVVNPTSFTSPSPRPASWSAAASWARPISL